MASLPYHKTRPGRPPRFTPTFETDSARLQIARKIPDKDDDSALSRPDDLILSSNTAVVKPQPVFKGSAESLVSPRRVGPLALVVSTRRSAKTMTRARRSPPLAGPTSWSGEVVGGRGSRRAVTGQSRGCCMRLRPPRRVSDTSVALPQSANRARPPGPLYLRVLPAQAGIQGHSNVPLPGGIPIPKPASRSQNIDKTNLAPILLMTPHI